jgi:hypothetical protein
VASGPVTEPIAQGECDGQETQNLGFQTKSETRLRFEADMVAIKKISEQFFIDAEKARPKRSVKLAAG